MIQKGYKGIVKVLYMNPAVLWIDMITLYDEQIALVTLYNKVSFVKII